MGSSATEVVILAEDIQHQVFLRKFLIKIGFHPRKFRLVPPLAGAGSGEQFVREHYSEELRIHRRKANHKAVRLVIVTDADTRSVDERLRQLSTALVAAGEPDRASDEAVAIFVPRRNVETWIAYLGVRGVDETTIYPKLAREGECQPAVDRLTVIYRSPPTTAPIRSVGPSRS